MAPAGITPGIKELRQKARIIINGKIIFSPIIPTILSRITNGQCTLNIFA
jgi:hypothetical protein